MLGYTGQVAQTSAHFNYMMGYSYLGSASDEGEVKPESQEAVVEDLKRAKEYLLKAQGLKPTPVLQKAITQALASVDARMRHPGVTPGAPPPVTAPVTQIPVTATRPPAASQSVALPKLAPLASKPGTIRGRAVFADGRTVPQFEVSARGWAGEIHLGPTGTLPDLGMQDAKNGHYEFRPPSAYNRSKILTEALVTVIDASAQLTYKDRKYFLTMHPLDGERNGDSKGGFRRYVSKGVVRDFVLKMHGPKPGYQQNTPPRDTQTNATSDPSYNAFYGGLIFFTFKAGEGGHPGGGPFEGAVMSLTFTPNGPLLDGSASRPLVRTLRIKEDNIFNWHEGYFRDIPLCDYTLTATMTKADGESYPMRLGELGGDYRSSFAVQFKPWDTIRSVETVNVYATR